MSTRYKKTVQDLLAQANIEINGSRPWDIKVHNEELYKRVLAGGSLALGESYMDGWWDADRLDEFFNKVLRINLESKVVSKKAAYNVLLAQVTNLQTKKGSKKVAQQHYDLNNDFYEKMLDSRMQYTCGYWKDADNLEDAQKDKLDLICKKLDLKEGENVLELGGGWGWFARFAAENYGCKVKSYNISKEQVAYAKKHTKGLSVEFVLDDYRNAKGQFDKVASIGMCEHVGYKNYRTFMEVAHKNLKLGGLFLIHTIAGNKSVKITDAWFHKYIFPNSMLPSAAQLGEAMEKLFVLEDWHNFGPYYDRTLLEWMSKVDKNWDEFKEKFGERFYRMWKYYLLASAGGFRARKNQLWQIVLSKGGVIGGYKSIR